MGVAVLVGLCSSVSSSFDVTKKLSEMKSKSRAPELSNRRSAIKMQIHNGFCVPVEPNPDSNSDLEPNPTACTTLPKYSGRETTAAVSCGAREADRGLLGVKEHWFP